MSCSACGRLTINLVRFADIGGDELRLTAGALDNRDGLFGAFSRLLHITDDDLCPFPRIGDGGGATDPAVGTRHKASFSIEECHNFSFFSYAATAPGLPPSQALVLRPFPNRTRVRLGDPIFAAHTRGRSSPKPNP